MECRICLESDDPETMLQPCQCRGTAAYVHQRCLERYFDFYPDGVCRVCMSQIVYYTHDAFANILYLLFMLGFLFVISHSHATPQFRLLLSLSTGAALYGYRARRLETRNMIGIISTILILYSLGNPDFQLTIAIVLFTVFYALTIYIPPNYLGMTVFICMLGFYTGMSLHAMQMFLDNHAQGVTVALAVLVWNLCISARPALHLD